MGSDREQPAGQVLQADEDWAQTVGGRSRHLCPADRRHRQGAASRLAGSEAACDEQSFATSFAISFATMAPAALSDAQGKAGARDGRGDALPSRNAGRAEPGDRDGAGGGASGRATTIWQSNLAEGGEPRDVEFEVYRDADSGPALRRTNVAEAAGLYFDCRADAGAGHRGEYGDFQRGQRRAARTAALPRSATTGADFGEFLATRLEPHSCFPS